jgi:ABC-2 type transport system permease protein
MTDVKYAIDLYPGSRNMTMRGQQTIVNQMPKPLTEVHFTLSNDYQTTIEKPGARLSQDDKRLHYQVYALTTPMQPGESRVMQFTIKTRVRGFENSFTNRAAAERHFHS